MQFFFAVDDVKYSGQTENISVYSNGSLHIAHVTKIHQGVYSCIVSNGVEPNLEATATVTVYGNINRVL